MIILTTEATPESLTTEAFYRVTNPLIAGTLANVARRRRFGTSDDVRLGRVLRESDRRGGTL